MRYLKCSVILLAILLSYTLSVAYAFQYFFTTEKHQIGAGLIITKHDIDVTGIELCKNIVAQGYSISMNVTLANQGNYIETLNITTYANTTAINQTRIVLGNGNSVKITFAWNTSGLVKGNYTIEAFADTVQGEIETWDNTHSIGPVLVTVPGDVSGDIWVDMQDISIIIDWFMTSHPEYNANCDINNDLSIDMADISIAIDNFMQT